MTRLASVYYRPPSIATIQLALDQRSRQPFSYTHVGMTRDEHAPGYILDRRRVRLGEGAEVFQAGCDALRGWEMFRLDWIRFFNHETPLEPGETVGVLVQVAGLWWLNTCRVVYLIEEAGSLRRFGFAYGTLPGHAEKGEERFVIEWREDDSVWFEILALSRPGNWLVRLGYPYARSLQHRFARGALDAMRNAVHCNSTPVPSQVSS